MNSQQAHDDCRVPTDSAAFGDVNAADGRDQVYNSAANAIEVGKKERKNFFK